MAWLFSYTVGTGSEPFLSLNMNALPPILPAVAETSGALPLAAAKCPPTPIVCYEWLLASAVFKIGVNFTLFAPTYELRPVLGELFIILTDAGDAKPLFL